ncbi:MAG TPA: DUF885 family protein [Sphingomicrobium sp.]|nr:DUF885 family protein [Sphingomicrobium sp.]
MTITPLAETSAAVKPAPAPASSGHPALVALFADWRAFNQPALVKGIPDYSAAAMAAKAERLPEFKSRLAAFDTAGWTARDRGDWRLVQAEMNGLDFYMRVLRPWARDPGFYLTVFPDLSDVPAHEGTYAEPVVDLFAFAWPLSPADDARLATQLETVAPLLEQARTNLAQSDAHDLWAYGGQGFLDQANALASLEQGKLAVRDLDGHRQASIEGASPRLKRAVAQAREASTSFAKWVSAEAPKRTGPSGVGKEHYNWYLKHVLLSPYSFDDQKVILERELERSLASLRLEEVRNRRLPPAAEVSDPAAFGRLVERRTDQLYALLVDSGMIAERPYFRKALEAQRFGYTAPADRNFFSHVSALDPGPLMTHFVHWIELARLKHEPLASPIRQVAPLFNIYADRSEGYATAMEEIVMQAGYYDDVPRGREAVWIMLANRAARGLASLRVQANEIGLDEAGKFHAAWTPRGYSDPASPLVGFEQVLYLRQPGYGPSYIVGKAEIDRLLATASHRSELQGKPFSARDFFAAYFASGIVPHAIIQDEMTAQ